MVKPTVTVCDQGMAMGQGKGHNWVQEQSSGMDQSLVQEQSWARIQKRVLAMCVAMESTGA